MTIKEIQTLAEKHGLLLTENMTFNEMGIDFKVGFATDSNGQQWLLRIPRRGDMGEQIDKERRILELVKQSLSVEVPDWKICSSELVAYPLLKNKPVLTFDSSTYELSWNIDKDNPYYITSLAKALVELHGICKSKAEKNNLKIMTAESLRQELDGKLQLVKAELGISDELETRYRKWLDNDILWPSFTQFIHGDLYAGHVLTSDDGTISGIIDWSTAHVGDPSIDFSGHATVFGKESLKVLIMEYEKSGGQVWEKLYEQSLERAAAAPLAYGFFALETQDEAHISAAKAQLGVEVV